MNLLVINQENPYEYARSGQRGGGRGGEEHIDTLAQKYINQDKYPWRAARAKCARSST